MTSTPPGWYPAPGEPAQVQRWRDGTQWTDAFNPPRALVRPRSKAPLIALIVAAVVVLPSVGLGVTVLGGVIELASEFDKTQEKLDSLYIWALDERPGYAELVARYESVEGDYRDKYDTGEIFTIVPDTAAGKDYYYEFIALLSQNSDDLQQSAAMISTDAHELDEEITFRDSELTELVRKFEANEGLVEPVTVVDHNGTTVVSDDSVFTPATDEALAFVAAYQGQPDANGSYAAAGSELVEPFGMYLNWVDGTGHSACISNGNSSFVTAYYCRLEPQIIYINQSYVDESDPDFLDTVRHELAHHLIGEICGVSSPPIAGARNEGVANSFAILYLGMSEAHPPSSGDYAVDAATAQAATGIHGGDCG